MNNVRINSILAILFLFYSILTAQQIPEDSLYLGQKAPGSIPIVFELQTQNNLFNAERIAINADGKEIYYQELDGYSEMDGKPHIVRTKYFRYENDRWTGPFKLFDELFAPFISLSGDTMYLQKGVTQAFLSVRENGGWSKPKRVFSKFYITHYFQATDSRNNYISALPPNTVGQIDFSRMMIKDIDTSVSSLGIPLNTPGHNFDFFVSPTEDYMIITTAEGLAVSFPKNDGAWTNPKNLGKNINFGLNEWGPYVTRDGKFLFYTAGTKMDYSDTHIYWVRLGNMIDSLRKTNNKPYVRRPIPNQTVDVGENFKLIIPNDTFTDDDENSSLSLSACITGGDPLPVWLNFSNEKLCFSGVPVKEEEFSVSISATDEKGGRVSCLFKISVEKKQ